MRVYIAGAMTGRFDYKSILMRLRSLYGVKGI